ncbi:unnamed protein product [Cuscuta epithymum]|uniref:Uncharacterized protein n=1 Tax=Cuscuta epithymum TaxID=186058 RepID=A0AAV0CA54_9ASTE|nr:unnamed protein product [Cuscuta epithymum]
MLCEEDSETEDHLFRYCRVADAIWQHLGTRFVRQACGASGSRVTTKFGSLRQCHGGKWWKLGLLSFGVGRLHRERYSEEIKGRWNQSVGRSRWWAQSK